MYRSLYCWQVGPLFPRDSLAQALAPGFLTLTGGNEGGVRGARAGGRSSPPDAAVTPVASRPLFGASLRDHIPLPVDGLPGGGPPRNEKAEMSAFAVDLLARGPGRLATAALLVLAASAVTTPVVGEEAIEVGGWSLLVENDLFYGHDRDYTSGVSLAWATTGEGIASWGSHVAARLPWFPEEGRVYHGYAIGQNMYTPRDISLADPPQDDRPYAGWLYGTVGLSVESGRRLDQIGLTLGVVGPASLAEASQRLVHEVRDLTEPRGWDTQLGNEVGVLLTSQRSWREVAAATLLGFHVDLAPHVGGALGNVYTYGNAGVMLRCGSHLPRDHGPPVIQPSVPGSGYLATTGGFGWYVFAGSEGRAVARNIFLDGNTFRDSHSVDREPLVADLQAGFALIYESWRVTYTHVLRSPEFDEQNELDQFGAITLSVRF